MALQAAFKQFLLSPNTSLLADDASIHYITTLVTYNGPAEIIKHLKLQSHQLKKKKEDFLDVVEGQDALAVEVETTIEFLTGGGAYLPALDDNFLADRIVTFPIIYIASFDGNGKIAQIRQHWDQGSLLKLIDVIGKSGRNWPIRDGKDQIKLIASSVKSAGTAKTSGGASAPKQAESLTRSRENSTNVTRDPHASLSLFTPRDHSSKDAPTVIAPRAAATSKPPPREYSELFVGHDSDSPDAPTVTSTTHDSAESPSKAIAPKGGAGRNYQPIRLFDNDENSGPSPAKANTGEVRYLSDPKKYHHFDFADGSDPQDAPRPAPLERAKSKHDSQWNFDDFNTPAKVVPTKLLRGQEIRHWGNEDDEVVDSPIRPKRVDKPRKDAETHFEFVDDGTPEGERRLIGRPRGAGQNTGLGLYENHLYQEDGSSPAKNDTRVLGNISNIKDRRKDFDPHFTLSHDSPASKESTLPTRLAEDKLRHVKMMDANWAATDQSPIPNQKENAAPSATSPVRPGTGKGPLSETTNAQRSDKPKGISIGGDGMGGRKTTLSDTTNAQRGDKSKGISIGGDGMGGRKGTGRSWGFGDDSDGEEAGGLNGAGGTFRKGMASKKPGPNVQTTGGDFWDF